MTKRLILRVAAPAAAVLAAVLLTGAAQSGSGSDAASSTSPASSVNPGGPMIPAPSPTPRVTVTTTKQPITQPVTIEDTHGRVLQVRAEVGGCQTAKLLSRETPSTVTLTVEVTTTHRLGQMCPFYIGFEALQTRLAAPLDGRTLIDGATGKQLPAPASE